MRSFKDSICSRTPSVYLLKPGSIKRDEHGAILDASSSVILIVGSGQRIVVDSGQPGDEDAILIALAKLDIKPQDVDIILNTHSHSDHCGNNHLFSGARTPVVRNGDLIAPDVLVLASPGHSPDSISIVVKNEFTIVIAGDALPTLGNFQKMVPPALHTDIALAKASMSRIIEIADIVVPGHDLPFSLEKEAYLPHPLHGCLQDH
ncbi:MAG: MBL fold metallo-hydrolase [Methanothrix sp.]|jgi:glyoxylase-like metal-dependent hydrolase (beta-lactamase superfamily II)|nr:MBL fold metallo-hydrolase [Methanothrix sp.]